MLDLLTILFKLLYRLTAVIRSKELPAEVNGSSKPVSNSLLRSTFSALPHRSKSFKLNFGDVSDDVHVGVQCLRAIMNNQVLTVVYCEI